MCAGDSVVAILPPGTSSNECQTKTNKVFKICLSLDAAKTTINQ